MEICAVVRRYVQIGPDQFEMQMVTRVFSISRSIQDILAWVESMGIKSPTCKDFILADHTGSTL